MAAAAALTINFRIFISRPLFREALKHIDTRCKGLDRPFLARCTFPPVRKTALRGKVPWSKRISAVDSALLHE
jgi:hypothetical protein